jgi:hypothetical protein
MDPINLAFYALICGTLGWAGPRLGAPIARIGLGAAVGIVAAAALPVLKGLFGLG